MKGDGSVRAPVYNDLKGGVSAAGEFTLTFKGYNALNMTDKPKVQLIVKALLVDPASKELQLVSPTVMFKSFQATRILLSILDRAAPVEKDIVAKLELMVEISMFEAA